MPTSRGLIHRDIKPENVILTTDGGVKLADLGLARLTADEKWAMAEAGMAIGTPEYISPEQVRGQVDVDIRADIYSLGATLYHMVTGQVPYGGDTPDGGDAEARRQEDVTLIPPDHINTKLSERPGGGRRDDDGQESGEPVPRPRRPDPRPQVPAPGRPPDDRGPEARFARLHSPRVMPRRAIPAEARASLRLLEIASYINSAAVDPLAMLSHCVDECGLSRHSLTCTAVHEIRRRSIPFRVSVASSRATPAQWSGGGDPLAGCVSTRRTSNSRHRIR